MADENTYDTIEPADNCSNLDLLDVRFVSTVHENDMRLIPTTFLIISDHDPFWSDSRIDQLYKDALEADQHSTRTTLSIPITGLSSYTDNIVTIELGEGTLDQTYLVNVPVQYIQVGRIFNRVWKLPAFYIISASEFDMYSEDLPHDDAPFHVREFLLPVTFVDDINDQTDLEINNNLNYQMYNADGDLHEDEDDPTSIMQRMFPVKVSINLTADEYNQLRAEFLNIILGLMRGDISDLEVLYAFGEELDEATGLVKDKLPLKVGHRHSLLMYDLVENLFQATHPQHIIDGFLVSDEEAQNLKEFQNLMSGVDPNLENIFEGILKEHEVNNEGVPFEDLVDNSNITKESSNQAKRDYINQPTNQVPLIAGLDLLKSDISTDLLYSCDWNDPENDSVELYQSKGEHLIIMALVITQRLLMFSKTLQDEEEDGVELYDNPVILGIILHSMIQEDEPGTWIIQQAVRHIGIESPLLFNEFMKFILSSSGGNMSTILEGPFGTLLHHFGHKLLDEEWSEQTLQLAFTDTPLIQQFTKKVFELKAEEEDESDSADADEDDADGEGHGEMCFVAEAILDLVQDYGHVVEFFPVIYQMSTAFKMIADLNAMKNTDASRNTPEWDNHLLDYFEMFLE